MNRKSIHWGIIFSIVLSSLIFILGLDRKNYIDSPMSVYQVYLNGKTVGIIEKEDDLYDLIDREQESLKKEYNVKKIYAPIGLETTKLVTYTGKVDKVEEVYDKIKDVEPFTVKGYEITIAHSEDNLEKINVLRKEDFDEAIDNTIKAFVDEEQYEKYLASKQEAIVTTGQTIENISIRENITIKEKYLSTEDKIYTDPNELSRYLLFGTTEAQGTHIVKSGETIKDIAKEYELNVREFLIVNPDIISENSLLFSGQIVNVGLINPIIGVVVENNLVQDQTVEYSTDIEYDNKMLIGQSYTSQVGQNGLSRVTYYTESINGTITQLVRLSEVQITAPVTEIIVKGGLAHNYIGEGGNWRWPTLQPYVITEYFGWRTNPVDGDREFHRGIDISGTGYYSPIYAADSGTITQRDSRWDMGNNIWINHNNGFQTVYMHLADFAPNIQVGSQVSKGELIGYMGSTGQSTGTHLDFRVIYNGEYLDPLSLTYSY